MKHALPKGFTLLISIVLATVALSVALALIDVAYKQVVLAITVRQSQYAFYRADALIECALYYDQTQNAFSYDTPATSITCEGHELVFSDAPNSSVQNGGVRTTTLTMPCDGGGSDGMIVAYKHQSGVPSTYIYGRGYSSCNEDDDRRVERGLRVFY